MTRFQKKKRTKKEMRTCDDGINLKDQMKLETKPYKTSPTVYIPGSH